MADDQYRGLLTEREKEIIKGEADVSEDYQYRVTSRVRNKIKNVEEDANVLKSYRKDLYQELKEAIN